ncbi:MAG: DNA cytosine methyltransferase, partial [Kiritimatiellaeota bacterium]|nr:DNA cytosine methyltransferase [Kiritimatiellota bacterium]
MIADARELSPPKILPSLYQPEYFKIKSMNSLGLVSLFSGCGGFDLGFLSEGFKSYHAFDFDAIAADNYRRNVAPCISVADLTKDIPTFSKSRNTSIILAGPPCQGFSTVGKRDPADQRNRLLPLAGSIGIKIKPLLMVFENVSAALSGEQAKHWDELNYRLRLSGYWTNTIDCNAMNLGMAQRRRRIFLFAWRTKRETCFRWPEASPDRLDKVLFGVENQANHCPRPLAPGSRLYQISERIGPGQKLSNVRGGPRSIHTWNIPEVFGPTSASECAVLETVMRIRRSERNRDFGDADPVTQKRLADEFDCRVYPIIRSLVQKKYLRHIDSKRVDLVHTFNGKCRRFRWDDISCTVDTRFGDPHLFLHPNEHRPFTVREAARIQG